MANNRLVNETEQTSEDFPEAYRELLGKSGISQRSFADKLKRIDPEKKGLRDSYLSNLGTGKQRPTKGNIELIAKGFDINPIYFKEYRDYLAEEELEKNPKLADAILDKDMRLVASAYENASEEEKQEVIEDLKEILKKRGLL